METINSKKYQPNGTKENIKLNILHEINGFYISNEGNKRNPNFHVWRPNGTHVKIDSAYSEISLAVARCNYIANNK